MAAFGGFQFASPAQYGDWAQYAGFNRTTGEIEDSRFAQAAKTAAGIPPPQTMQEMVSQRFAPVQQRVGAIAPGMQQMAQGNIMQGINTLRGTQPSGQLTGQPAAQQQPQSNPADYDYTYGL